MPKGIGYGKRKGMAGGGKVTRYRKGGVVAKPKRASRRTK
jgi:hypothetical protein